MKKQCSMLGMAFVCCFLLVCFFSTVRADLVGLWKFEELAGDVNAIDSSAYGNNGVLVAGPNDPCSPIASMLPRRINNVHGKIGNHGLEFGTPRLGVAPTISDPNRSWNYVDVPYSVVLKQLALKWSIAFWYKQYTNNPAIQYGPGGGSGYQRALSCPNYEVELGVPGDLQDYFWPYTAPVWEIPIGTSQSLNVWHHFALTYDGITLKRYDDGAVIFSTPIAGQRLPDAWLEADFLKFGTQTYPLKDFFIGALDEVAIFSECLDANEVTAIKGGNFAGPWEEIVVTYESDPPTTYLWDSTFIAQKDTIVLDFDERRIGNSINVPSWNWTVEGTLSDANYYGLVNAGEWDGDPTTAEYAAYTTVGDNVVQPKPGDYGMHRRIHKNTVYDLRTRFGGVAAVGNVIGVKIYAADVNDPNIKTLLADLSQTIATNETWYELATTFTADAATYPSDNKTFRAECYVNQGSGNPRGTAFGYFDYVRIDVNDFLTCEALYYYNNGTDPALPRDFNKDCRMNFEDYVEFALDWMAENNPEPIASSSELLTNNDFYANLSIVPLAGNTNKAIPTGWQIVPSPADTNEGGLWNVSQRGLVDSFGMTPAGGSVAAFIDPNRELQQAVSSPTIVNGQTYYLSAMLGGVDYSYQNIISMIYEYVNSPTSPTTIVEIARQEYVLPYNTVWRRFCTEWIAPPAAAGKYFRVRAEYGPPAGFTPDNAGWGLIANVSIDTVKPSYWQRSNLLTNGDFEDYSNLPMGTLDDMDGWINLFTYNGWTWNYVANPSRWPPGWTFQDEYTAEGGLQCMFWAPAPQPSHGRLSLVIGTNILAYPDSDPRIDQKVTSETIQSGQTYYLDFIGCISASAYNNGTWDWPQPDPNIVVELYWLNTGQDNIYSGTQGVDWDFITTLKQPADDGMGARGGHWQKAFTSFTAPPSLAGKSFFMRAYGEAPYTTFEEIYLSKEAPITVEASTCAELIGQGNAVEMDFNGDCVVNFADLRIFVSQWLECNDPAGCD